MAHSVHSDQLHTRYSTPEPDLDDHRFQPESLPPAIEISRTTRRGTLASIADDERPQRPRLDLPTASQMEIDGITSRDFENAIIDDDQSVRSGRSGRSNHSRRTVDEEWHMMRRTSGSPVAARRSTFRRAIHNRQRDNGRSSRNSSRSRRSSSPPNSVDAFAPPRRGRSGTMNSMVPSETNLTIPRPPSNAAQSRRRLTFGDEGNTAQRTDVASVRSSVQEDVCFPPEEPPNNYTIDFEDLEEFVAVTHPKTPVAHPFTSRFTAQVAPPKRVFKAQVESGCDYFGDETEKYGITSGDKYATESEEKVDVDVDVDAEASQENIQRIASFTEMQNRFTFFSSEIDETVHAPELGGLLMPGETFRDLFELGPEGGVWWLDMLNPSEEEIFAICGAFRVHPLTREDITTQETREKVELFKSYYFMCFTSFNALDKTSEDYLEPINVYAVVFREGILTFSFCQNSHAANVRKRISRLRDYVNLSADWVCYALIDEIVDSYGPVLRDVERETDTIEDSVFTARFEDSRAVLKQIGECRKRVMSLLRLLGGKADVIKGFAKKCNESYSVAPRGDVGLYLSDVQDHIVTMLSNLGHFEKMLSRSHSNHLTQITLQHTEQGSRANELLGKITVFATILVPLNLIAGLFGMNVDVPGKNADGLGWWFGIIGVMGAICVVGITVAKFMKFV